jgi:hypothetical protein
MPTAELLRERYTVTYNPSLFRIYHLHRLQLQLPYPAQVSEIGYIMGRLPRTTDLFVDYTGVGRGIFDMLVDRGLRPIGVTMTGGDEVHHHGSTVSVPKSTLVSKLVAKIHARELAVPDDLAVGWPALKRELMNYRTEVTAAGNETWNSKSGEHDDLIVAVSLCIWGLGDDAVQYGGLMRWYAKEAGQLGNERYCVGVDLGQALDPTAICVMCRIDNPSLSDVRDESFMPA